MTVSTMLSLLSEGFVTSLLIFALTLLFSMPLGLAVMFGRRSRLTPLRGFIKAYISIMRGTPLMLQLMVVFYGPKLLLGVTVPGNWRFTAVIVAFVINYAAYFAEIYRGGIESIPRGQYEAAQVLGYTKAQTFFKIILPQMVKRVIPAVTNEVITLVKDTSLASVIGTVEMFTRAKQIVASPNTPGMLALVAAGVFYYVFNYVVAFAMEKWEQALRYYREREGRAMAVFEMRNAKKAFGALEVLKGVSLKVEKGEVVSIIGPSGGGKSTMLRCATLLETMDSGTLAYSENVAAREENGKSVYAGKAALAQVRRQFGLVFQQFDLFPHYTVLKNVCDAPISVQKRDRAEVEAEAMALLDKMGLKGKENAYPYQLSGGQQQRVAIARALAMKPEILFFDEPTSALDPLLTGEVLRVIRSLADEHMTMVIVTHEMPFARAVSDRVVFLDGGVIVEQGSPEQVFENPQQERTREFLKSYRETSSAQA